MAFPPWLPSQFMDLWRRIFPRSYTGPIEEGGGVVLIEAEAAMAARVSDAENTTQQAYYLLPSSSQTGAPSSGAAYALASVQISRTAPVGYSATLIAGTLVQSIVRLLDGTEIDGIMYELVADVVFDIGELGPLPATIRATTLGSFANGPQTRPLVFPILGENVIPGTMLTGNSFEDTPGVPDRFTISDVGRFVRSRDTYPGSDPRRIVSFPSYSNDPAVANVATLDGPAFAGTPAMDTILVLELSELGFSVELTSAITGGLDGELDAIGDERRVYRQEGEGDSAYRQRIVQLPDVVSPGAILRMASRILGPCGIQWRYIDAGDSEVFTGFVWLPPLPGQMAYEAITIDWSTRRRAFAIAVGLDGTGDVGMFYDGTNPADDNALDDGAFADGYPPQWTAALRQLWVQMNEIRAGGVAGYILIDPQFFP